jgi:hypothetical protein
MSKIIKISIFSQPQPNRYRTETIDEYKRVRHVKLTREQIQYYIDNGASVVTSYTSIFVTQKNNKSKVITEDPVSEPKKNLPQLKPQNTDLVSSTDNSTVTPTETIDIQPKKKTIQIDVSDTSGVKDR